MEDGLITPTAMFRNLIYLNFRQAECIQDSQKFNATEEKIKLKREIVELTQKIKQRRYLENRKKEHMKRIEQLLEYRKSVDYENQNKILGVNIQKHVLRNNLALKEELILLKQENIHKKGNIKQLQNQILSKQKIIQKNRDQKLLAKQEQTLRNWRDKPIEKNWVTKMKRIKQDYLSSQKQYRRAKIVHDYHLMLSKTKDCVCLGNKNCEICCKSPICNSAYSREAMLSPRYKNYINRYQSY